MTLSELKEKCNSLLRANKFEELFELLGTNINPDTNAATDITIQQAAYNRTFQDENTCYISREDARLEYARVTRALGILIQRLADSDLGNGSMQSQSALETMAKNLPVTAYLTPMILVNCDRKAPFREFRRAFNRYKEQNRGYQFYFLKACPTQQPESFAQRSIFGIIDDLEEEDTVEYPRLGAEDSRCRIELLPFSDMNVAACQRAFKKYFAERFKLGNSDLSFEEYLRSGLPRLRWKYVATAFKITPEQWEDDITGPYLEWIMETFSHTRPDIPTFIFFFLFPVNNIHREDVSGNARDTVEGVRKLVEKHKENTTLIQPLLPVHCDDFEYWLETIGDDVQQHQKDRIIELMAKSLQGEEAAWYREKKEFNMETIERFQNKVYQFHKYK